MASGDFAGRKGAISQALIILRDTIRDLPTLLRDDAVFYISATVITYALLYVGRRPFGSFALLATLLIGAAVAGTRSAERFGGYRSTRAEAIKRYVVVNVKMTIAIAIATIPLIIAYIVAVVIFWHEPFNLHSFTQAPQGILAQCVFAIWTIAVNTKVGAAPALGILSDRPEPILTTWRLTGRVWPLSLALACPWPVLGSILNLILPGSHRPAPPNILGDLIVPLLLQVLFARAYVQFAREMLDATETKPTESLAP
jgi:hypothetical protein